MRYVCELILKIWVAIQFSLPNNFLKRLFAVFQTERKEPQSEISLLSFASNLVVVVSSYAKS